MSDQSTISVYDIDTFIWKREITLSESLTIGLYGVQVLQRWGERGLVAADADTLVIIQDALE